jgi:hypothetical protein
MILAKRVLLVVLGPGLIAKGQDTMPLQSYKGTRNDRQSQKKCHNEAFCLHFGEEQSGLE